MSNEQNHADDPWIGRQIADTYRLDRLIGAGGVGRVYAASSDAVSRPFAVKIVDPDRESVLDTNPQRVRARLEREIAAQAQLRNPHIVQLFDVVDLPGDKLAIVMDLVRGETLRQLVSRHGPLPFARACDILRQIANGVHEAHEAGMVHRDLKPANIMIEVLPAGGDFVRVFDFGIVCLQDAAAAEHEFVGTPLFASPEQALGDQIDRRSDIYSLGAVWFYMLTGRPPFMGRQPVEVLLAHCQESPPRLSEALPGRAFPDEFEDLVARFLAKRRDERPKTLAQVITELDALSLVATEGLAHDSSCQSQLSARQSAATVVSEAIDEDAGSTKAGMGDFGMGLTELGAPGLAPGDRSVGEETGMIAAPSTPKASPRDSRLSDAPAPAAQILYSPTILKQRRSAEAARDAKPQPSGPSTGLIESRRRDLAVPTRAVTVPESMVRCPFALTPDGRLVYLGADGDLHLVDPLLQSEWSIALDLGRSAASLALAPGAAFVGTLDGEVIRYGFDTERSQTIYESPYGIAVDSLAVDRRGRWLVLSNCNGEVRCAAIDGPQNPAWRRIPTHAARVQVDIADDGDSMAILAGASNVQVHSTDWPHTLLAEVELGTPLHSVRISRTGGRLAGLTQKWQLGVWRLPDGDLLRPLRSLDEVIGVDFTTSDELVVLQTSSDDSPAR